jgi:hypothetical protein
MTILHFLKSFRVGGGTFIDTTIILRMHESQQISLACL